jgi:hypothetical protein
MRGNKTCITSRFKGRRGSCSLSLGGLGRMRLANEVQELIAGEERVA